MINDYIDIITEEIDSADEIIKNNRINFNSFETKSELNKDIFDESNHLKESVLDSLISIYKTIVKTFDFLRESVIDDVVLVGSLVSYHYSSYSDIDLHIIIDTNKLGKNKDEIKESLDEQRKEWNDNNDIEIEGYEVELYFQDKNEKNESNGVYSLLDDDWIKFPDEENPNLDKKTIEQKSLDLIEKIDNLEKVKNPKKLKDKIINLWDKIVKGRKEALKSEGEFSNENIIFKILRRTNHLKKLKDLKNKIGIMESNNPRQIYLDEINENIEKNVRKYLKSNGNKISEYELKNIIRKSVDNI